MSSDLAILRLARGLAAHSAARQSLVARNVANADTPGYRAADMPSFAEALARAGGGDGFAARATRPGHAGAAEAPALRLQPRLQTAMGASSPNGNTVSLEDQMFRAAEAKGAWDLAVGVYGKSLDLLRAGLGRGR